MPVSIVIPALNEAESIGFVLDEMPWQTIAECIVVDNGSTDQTAEIAAGKGARVIRSERGYGAACMTGAAAAAPGSDILVFMDGDGSDMIAALSELVGPIERGEQDFVVGSRLGSRKNLGATKTRAQGSMLVSQIFAGWFVGSLLHLVYGFRTNGFRYTDMGPFRAIRRSSLESFQMRERTYGWSLEMQIKAIQHRLRILEVPVGYRVRFGGVSKVSGDLRASARAAVRILQVLVRVTLQGRS